MAFVPNASESTLGVRGVTTFLPLSTSAKALWVQGRGDQDRDENAVHVAGKIPWEACRAETSGAVEAHLDGSHVVVHPDENPVGSR